MTHEDINLLDFIALLLINFFVCGHIGWNLCEWNHRRKKKDGYRFENDKPFKEP